MNDDVFNLEEVMERVQDDKELLCELLEIFKEDYLVKRVQLGEAVKELNIEQIKSIAHSLKGATGNIAAGLMRQQFISLEDMAKADDFSSAQNTLAELDKQYVAFTERIESLKDQLT